MLASFRFQLQLVQCRAKLKILNPRRCFCNSQRKRLLASVTCTGAAGTHLVLSGQGILLGLQNACLEFGFEEHSNMYSARFGYGWGSEAILWLDAAGAVLKTCFHFPTLLSPYRNCFYCMQCQGFTPSSRRFSKCSFCRL